MNDAATQDPTMDWARDWTHDWTQGGDQLLYQHCLGCRHVWYFRRGFCPACGQAEPAAAVCIGTGIVQACTQVERAPNDEFRALLPYVIVLVDLDEGFRTMGHGAPGLVIGDRVLCAIRTIAGKPLPYFELADR